MAVEKKFLTLAGNVDLAVATNRVGDLFGNPRRNREFRELFERAQNFFGGVSSGTSVPQTQAGNAIGVDVLGCSLKISKDG